MTGFSILTSEVDACVDPESATVFFDALADSGGIKSWNAGLISKCPECLNADIRLDAFRKALQEAHVFLMIHTEWKTENTSAPRDKGDRGVAVGTIECLLQAVAGVPDEYLDILDSDFACYYSEQAEDILPRDPEFFERTDGPVLQGALGVRIL